VQLVHPLNTSAEDRAILKARGVSYSTSPTGESRRPGDIQFAELLQDGVKVSMSIDHTTTYNCDCFVCMRMLYSMNWNRMRRQYKLTTKRLVEFATIDGAQDLGIADKVGSLTPGKRADLILIRTSDPNLVMMGDPYDALVTMAEPANIDTVIIDGRILRHKGQFTALDQDQIVKEAWQTVEGLRARAKWP
jgi:cytosine/adenosine deaminase-related metal-dependent hydrolase